MNRTLVVALLLFFPRSTFANELEFLIYRAPQPLEWSTPGQLVRSAYHNAFRTVGYWDGEQYRYDVYPHSISHVNVKIQCDQEPVIYRGMTSDRSNFAYAWDLMVRGRALETFLIDVKGRFYKNDEILRWLPILEGQGYVRRFKLLLNDNQCARVSRYLRQYERLQLQNIYGNLRSEPQWGQGAGCAAFAVSFLKVLDLLPEELGRKWRHQLKVPLHLLSSTSRKASVSFWGYLWGENSRWARESEPHITLDFYDPELIYDWIGPRGSVLWNVQNHPVPTRSFFKMSEAQIRENRNHHLAGLNQLLSERELRDAFSFECQTWGYCRPSLSSRPSVLTADLAPEVKSEIVPDAPPEMAPHPWRN